VGLLVGDDRRDDQLGAVEQRVPKSQLVEADDGPASSRKSLGLPDIRVQIEAVGAECLA